MYCNGYQISKLVSLIQNQKVTIPITISIWELYISRIRVLMLLILNPFQAREEVKHLKEAHEVEISLEIPKDETTEVSVEIPKEESTEVSVDISEEAKIPEEKQAEEVTLEITEEAPKEEEKEITVEITEEVKIPTKEEEAEEVTFELIQEVEVPKEETTEVTVGVSEEAEIPIDVGVLEQDVTAADYQVRDSDLVIHTFIALAITESNFQKIKFTDFCIVPKIK